MPNRPIHLPLWSVLVLVVAAFLGPILSVTMSVRIARSNEAEAEQRRTEVAVMAREESRRVTCGLAATQLDAWKDAESDVGKASYRGWLDLYKLANCRPIR